MGYVSRYGRRPQEAASKSAHTFIINDENVKQFLKHCNLPNTSDKILIDPKFLYDIKDSKNNEIQIIIAVDGGYTEVPVNKSFPSSTISFFQFGASLLKIKDLEEMSDAPFISPEAIAKLKELQRLKFVLPTKNISLQRIDTLIDSVRFAIFDFFRNAEQGESKLETLKWFIFQMYGSNKPDYNLANCPKCQNTNIKFKQADLQDDYTFKCPKCRSKLYLTDVFRFHEVVDEELGAGGILGYLTNVIEHFIIIHTIRVILKIKPDLIKNTLFIKDGPLGFFGQTANMHEPMREMIRFLISKHDINLIGLEKSGAFVEHADEIKEKLSKGQVLLLSNKHIYTYILPGDPNNPDPYAGTSYYSGKMIFKSKDERVYVVTIPTLDKRVVMNPKPEDFHNLDQILVNVEKLRCDMYDNSLLPIAVVNKLVSLSNHPSAVLLEKFAKASL
jgi:predicted nucleic-acid-binding Zn-ribbon protein